MIGVDDLEPDAVDRQAVAGLDLLDRPERRLVRDRPNPLGTIGVGLPGSCAATRGRGGRGGRG
jgi:hypothetical protein